MVCYAKRKKQPLSFYFLKKKIIRQNGSLGQNALSESYHGKNIISFIGAWKSKEGI